MKINIRRATSGDIEPILFLNKGLFDYERKYNDEYNLAWTYSEKGRAYYEKRIESNDAIVLVAKEEMRTIGYILVNIASHSIRKVNPIAEIENLFVVEEYRGKGIGKQLIKKIKEEVINRGVKRLRVAVMADNMDGIRFYQSLGLSMFEFVLEENLA